MIICGLKRLLQLYCIIKIRREGGKTVNDDINYLFFSTYRLTGKKLPLRHPLQKMKTNEWH